MSRRVTVRYQVATYSGTIGPLFVEDDEDTETILARAKARLTRESGGSLPLGYQSFKIVDDEEEGE